MEIVNKLKRLCIFIGLTLFILLCGCSTTPSVIVNDSEKITNEIRWHKYGAVYTYDELLIRTEEFDKDHGYHSYFDLTQKIHILNKDGVKHGTIAIDDFPGKLMKFKVQLISSDGKEIRIDQKSLKNKYVKTGKIVVPKVEPGCQIIIKLTFGTVRPVYSYEHWFEKPIPVLRGRFSFYVPREFKYEHKSYAIDDPAQKVRKWSFIGYRWDQEEILPKHNAFGDVWHHFVEPRVLLRIKSFNVSAFNINYDALDWWGMARRYKKYFLSKSIFSSRDRIRKIVSDLVEGAENEAVKADAILEYVQDEISLHNNTGLDFDSINLNNILNQKKGNLWDLTVLLKEMLQAAGISNHVYLSRHRADGGFDPDFTSWRHLSTPLVAAEIEGKELIAYPYHRDLSIGEYPFGYHGAMGMKVGNAEIAPLPEPIYQNAKSRSQATLALENWDSIHLWRFSYEGHYATLMRIRLNDKTNKERDDYYKDIIQEYDPLNNLQSLTIKNLSRRGPVLIEATQSHKGFKTSHGGTTHYSLKPWFKKFFTSLDDNDRIEIANDIEVIKEESLLIKKKKNTQLSIHFACTDLDNPLFNSQCSERSTAEGELLTRTLTIKKAKLSSEQVQAIAPDIALLNATDESYVIEN